MRVDSPEGPRYLSQAEAELLNGRYVRALVNRLQYARAMRDVAQGRIDECMDELARLPNSVRVALAFRGVRGEE